MKKESLMIGDWVTLNRIDYKWQWTQHDFTASEFNALEPIPLTEEILEKNGWEKKGTPYEWRDNVWVQRWNLPIDKGNFQINDCPNYDGFTWNNVELKFVHTLQHALRLYGLDELADSFKI